MRLQFENTITAGDVDTRVMRPLGELRKPTSVELDLGSCTFIEPAATLYLVASLASAKAAGRLEGFTLELPRSSDARSFLRRWRFGTALERALDIDHRREDWLTTTSQAYRDSDVPEEMSYAPVRRQGPSGDLLELTSQRFFTTKVHQVDEVRAGVGPDTLADMERQAWESTDIRSILELHLGRRANLIAPGVIYETILNSIFHPGARSVVVLSHLNTESTQKYPHGLLTISVWDDGESIPATLRATLSAGNPLREQDFPHYYDWYAIYRSTAPNFDRWKHESTVHSGNWLPDEGDRDHSLLVASTFPGVSSAHSREMTQPRADRAGQKSTTALAPSWDKTGMGLYIVTSIVIDSFGGEVAIRSGDAFVNLKRAKEFDQTELRCRYRCNTWLQHSKALKLRGTQLTVRIPLMPRPR